MCNAASSRLVTGLCKQLGPALFAVSCWYARPALASPQTAAQHFDRAMEHIELEEIELAVQEFELAYAESPNYVVLNNLAQLYAKLGRPIQALKSFHRYLEEGGTRIGQARREQTQRLIAEQEAHVGLLRLELSPAGARALVNDQPEEALADGSIPLLPGVVTVTVSAPGHATLSRKLTIEAGKRTVQAIALEPLLEANSRDLVVELSCSVAGARVLLDREPALTLTAGQTQTLRVPHQTRSISFEKPGYFPQSVTVANLESGASIDCALTPLPQTSTVPRAEGSAVDTASSLKPWAIVLTGASAALGVSAGMLWLYNGKRMEEASRGLCVSSSTGQVVPCSDPERPLSQAERAQLERRDSVLRWDNVARGLALGSLAGLGAALTLSLWPDTEKPDPSAASHLLVTPQGIDWRTSF